MASLVGDAPTAVTGRLAPGLNYVDLFGSMPGGAAATRRQRAINAKRANGRPLLPMETHPLRDWAPSQRVLHRCENLGADVHPQKPWPYNPPPLIHSSDGVELPRRRP